MTTVQVRKNREKALKNLEERGLQNPRREFTGLLVSQLDGTTDYEMRDVKIDQRGPLGGRSCKVTGIFVDSKGKRHGVIINAYIGEPDIVLTEDDEVVGQGR